MKSFLGKNRKIIVTVSGENHILFLQSLSNANIHMQDIHALKSNTIQFECLYKDIFLIRSMRRQYSIQVSFDWKKASKRFPYLAPFIVGISLFLFCICFLSSFLWTIRIEGVEYPLKKEIKEFLTIQGITTRKLALFLPTSDELRIMLLNQFPTLTGVSILKEGTTWTFRLREQVKHRNRDVDQSQAYSLRARKKAFITRIEVEQGEIIAERNHWVEKDQLLVEGKGVTGENRDPISARGKVWGITWYQGKAVFPSKEVYFRIKEKMDPMYSLQIFNYRIGPMRENSKNNLVFQEKLPLYLLRSKTPLTVIKMNLYRIQKEVVKFPGDSILRNDFIRKKLESYLVNHFPFGTKILTIQFLRYQKKNDKVEVTFYLSLEEEISKATLTEVNEPE